MKPSNLFKKELSKIKIVVTDIDGVHTDDTIILSVIKLKREKPALIEGYRFFTGDGIAVKECLRAKIPVIFISGRNSPAIKQRAKNLGAKCLIGVEDKVISTEKVLAELGFEWKNVLFIGNDVQDLAVIKHAGFSAAPANAAAEIQAEVDYITKKKGGEGAVREIIELLLKAKGLWIY